MLENILRSDRIPTILQSESAECGLACLAMVSSFHGLKLDLAALRSRFSISSKGADLRTIIAISEQLELNARPLKTNVSALGQVRLPAILHWNMNHFVVLRKATTKHAEIIDPSVGRRRLAWDELAKHYTGIVLELEPASSFKTGDDQRRIRLVDLWSRMTGLKRSLIQLVALTLLIQFFVLVSPLFLQLVVDKAMAERDQYFLAALALSFGLFAFLSATTNLVRSYVLIYLSNIMSYQMIVNLFRHLIYLPQQYFDRRQIGDILSRFNSTQPIKNMLTEGLVAAFVDGVLAVTTLAMMFIYSAMLASISLGALLVHGTVVALVYRHLRAATQESIVFRASESTNFMETVRGMTTVKMYAKESERQNVWQNRLAKSVGAEARVQRNKSYIDYSQKLVFGLELVGVVYVAARMNIANEITVGGIFAYLAYKTQFTDKSMALVSRFAEFRMLSLHLMRISDIVLTEREVDAGDAALETEIHGELKIDDIYYRYSDSDPFVLQGVAFQMRPGKLSQFLAVREQESRHLQK